MADPVVTTLTTGSASTATVTPTFSAATAGDLLLLSVSSDDYKTADPSGWNLAASGADFQGAYLWWKIAAGGETSVSYTIGSATASAYVVLNATNIDPTPLFGTATSNHTHNAAASATTAITPTAGSRWLAVASFHAMHSGASSVGPFSGLTNSYTDQASASGGATTEVVQVGHLVLDGGTATSTTPGSWTINAPQCSYGLLAAFKVASGGTDATFVAPNFADAVASGGVSEMFGQTPYVPQPFTGVPRNRRRP